MRIAVFDDIHTEFGKWNVPALDADVVVLAGDIATTPEDYAAVAKALRDRNPRAQVVCILGNHEYYQREFNSAPAEYAAALALPQVHFLHNSAVAIGEWMFVGGTLWTDLADPKTASGARAMMNDYRLIDFREDSGFCRTLQPSDTTAAHLRTVQFIRDTLVAGDPSRAVVVTHHAPSWRSRPHHEGLEATYCAQLDAMIEELQPALWLHGHTHLSHDYDIGQTRVRNNPRGYVGRYENHSFDPACVVDVSVLREYGEVAEPQYAVVSNGRPMEIIELTAGNRQRLCEGYWSSGPFMRGSRAQCESFLAAEIAAGRTYAGDVGEMAI